VCENVKAPRKAKYMCDLESHEGRGLSPFREAFEIWCVTAEMCMLDNCKYLTELVNLHMW